LHQTENLQPEVKTGINDIMVRYIPNIKPNRMLRGSGLGNSDYQGNEGLFDSIDQVYTSWIKEIKLGQARIIVPEQWLERTNGKFSFNADREIFTALDIDPLSAKGQGINQVQFTLRVNEHKTTVEQLVMQAVTDAGYSPQSFGLNIAGNTESGTALNIRERKSSITRGKKQIFFRQAIQDIVQMLLIIDKAVFKTPGLEPFIPVVEFQDSLEFNIDQTCTTIETLNRAVAISTKVKVQMAHPQWSQDQINEEVDTILKESGNPIASVNIDNMQV
jgi:A118 family predicted phage portal protein